MQVVLNLIRTMEFSVYILYMFGFQIIILKYTFCGQVTIFVCPE